MSTPTTIGGLQLWLDSSDNATITKSGSTLTGWSDKSGNSNSSTSISGSPRISTQYSNQYIDFSSSQISGPVSITNSTLSVFSVCILPDNAGTYSRIVSLGDQSNQDFNDTRYTAALFVFLDTQNIGALRNNTNFSIGSNTLSSPIIAASIFDSANGTIYVNGTDTNAFASTGNFGINTYSLGSDVWQLAEFFSGSIGEVLIYNTALTLSQRQLIEGYLAWKWGLNAQLPVAHPYYSTNPNAAIPASSEAADL